MYKLGVCGGTFDRLHEGHKNFLRYIFSQSEQVLLGLTSDTFVKQHKKDALFVAPFTQRKQALQQFFIKEHVEKRVTIASIESFLYPSVWEKLPIEAIFVTNDTLQGAALVNTDRKKKGLSPLAVIVAPLITTTNREKISSSILRQSNPLLEKTVQVPEQLRTTLLLPKEERKKLQKPFGVFLTNESIPFTSMDGEKIITVGDVVTSTWNTHHIQQKISVIDFVVQRKHMYNTTAELGFSGNEILLTADNPSGHITPSLWYCLTQAFLEKKKRIIIQVVGEEDLAVLPLLLLAPIGMTIYYGQPNKGVVQVVVTEKTKQEAQDLMMKFTVM